MGLLILVFIGIPLGLGILLYFVTKKLGYPTAAKYVTIAFGLLVLTIGFYFVFEDHFFTKNNAKALVEEQEFELNDEFKITNNKSMTAIGDYYHAFNLEISERDRLNAINKIKSADNFKSGIGSTETLLQQAQNQDKNVTQNYETEDSYVREYLKPREKENYAPIFRRISISKTKNKLIFEDIDE
jgi:hypothetical protein